MFCGSITEYLPSQMPHLPKCSYGLVFSCIESITQS